MTPKPDAINKVVAFNHQGISICSKYSSSSSSPLLETLFWRHTGLITAGWDMTDGSYSQSTTPRLEAIIQLFTKIPKF